MSDHTISGASSTNMLTFNSLDLVNVLLNSTTLNVSKEEVISLLLQQKLSSWHMTGFKISMVIFYAVLFCIGIVGNLWVITILINVLRNLRLAPNQNIFVYILSLSAVDFFVVTLLPVLLSETVLSHWVFGRIMCKLYFCIESTNKILSTFILAALSFDRYLAVCRPKQYLQLRTPKGSLTIVVALTALVTVLLLPVHIYAEEIIDDEYVVANNYTFSIGVPKCAMDLSEDLIVSFTLYVFTVGFCLPSALIIAFYASILRYLHQHAKSLHSRRRTQIPLKRVTVGTLMIVMFYFACWTPYWATTLIAALSNDTGYMEEPIVAHLFYWIHSLVYVNSASNWVFYAFLNNNLRDSHDLAVEICRGRLQSVGLIGRSTSRLGGDETLINNGHKRSSTNFTQSELNGSVVL